MQEGEGNGDNDGVEEEQKSEEARQALIKGQGMPMGPVGPNNEKLITQQVQEQQQITGQNATQDQEDDDAPAEGTHELEQLD